MNAAKHFYTHSNIYIHDRYDFMAVKMASTLNAI